MQPSLPRSWTCRTHGAPVSFGCLGCDRIQGELAAMLRVPSKGLPALRLLAAELALRYAGEDATYSVSDREVRRSVRHLTHASEVYASEVRRRASDLAATTAGVAPRRRVA